MAYWVFRAIAVSVRCYVLLFDGVGIAVLRSISHFCPAHVAVGSEFQFAVGGRVVFHFGFSFPVMAMHPALQVLSNLFPLRHYFLIYVSQTLNGYPMVYAWKPYLALLLFVLLPLLLLRRLRTVMLNYDYIP